MDITTKITYELNLDSKTDGNFFTTTLSDRTEANLQGVKQESMSTPKLSEKLNG